MSLERVLMCEFVILPEKQKETIISHSQFHTLFVKDTYIYCGKKSRETKLSTSRCAFILVSHSSEDVHLKKAELKAPLITPSAAKNKT